MKAIKKPLPRTRYEQLPKKLKINHGSAWWYANRKNIEIIISPNSGPGHYIIVFPLAKLKEYVRRMTAK